MRILHHTNWYFPKPFIVRQSTVAGLNCSARRLRSRRLKQWCDDEEDQWIAVCDGWNGTLMFEPWRHTHLCASEHRLNTFLVSVLVSKGGVSGGGTSNGVRRSGGSDSNGGRGSRDDQGFREEEQRPQQRRFKRRGGNGFREEEEEKSWQQWLGFQMLALIPCKQEKWRPFSLYFLFTTRLH